MKDSEIKRVALECASRVVTKGDVRRVLDNAMLFEAWLKGDSTEVVCILKDRFPT